VSRTAESVWQEAISRWVGPGVPGVGMAVMREGEVEFVGSHGLADIEHGVPVCVDTRCLIGSVSKNYSAACLALMLDEGLLTLEDPVRNFIPELDQMADPIRLQDLLWHTSGLRDVHTLLVTSGWRDWDFMTHEDALDLIVRQRGSNFRPGETWSYCNSGYVLIAEVIRRVTGRSIRRFAAERFFEPLGMQATHVHDDPLEPVAQRARNYMVGADGALKLAEVNTGMVGTTGIYTTASDVARWDQNLRRGIVGGPELVRRMQSTGELGDGTPINYGFGLVTTELAGRRALEHNGGHGGARTHYIQFPDDEVSVFCWANSLSASVVGMASNVALALFDSAQELEVPPQGGQIEIPSGVYRDQASGQLTSVRRIGGRILLGVGDRVPIDFEPIDYVGPPEELIASPDGRWTAWVGADRRNAVSYLPDRDELSLSGLDYSVPRLFRRIGEVGTVEEPSRECEERSLGTFGNPELEFSIRATMVGDWLSISGTRFGPLFLEPMANRFACAGTTIEVVGNSAKPDALILTSDWVRSLPFRRI
jgi:CubicO group peptidase (beta-lactamase class C family)